MLDGKTVAGMPTRAADETPTRLEALRIYTQGSAWFAHDDARRGALAVGKLADLAVLTHDYLAVPVGGDRPHPFAAHHGGRPRGLCGGAVRRVGGEAGAGGVTRRGSRFEVTAHVVLLHICALRQGAGPKRSARKSRKTFTFGARWRPGGRIAQSGKLSGSSHSCNSGSSKPA